MMRSHEDNTRDELSIPDFGRPSTAKPSKPLTPEQQAQTKAEMDELMSKMTAAMHEDNKAEGFYPEGSPLYDK